MTVGLLLSLSTQVLIVGQGLPLAALTSKPDRDWNQKQE
jgi:hypothetical protein